MKKIITTTDLHFGAKGNSEQHNQDLLDFFEYLVNWKDKQSDDYKLVIMGDTFEHRDKLSVDTINFAIKGMEYLSENFDEIIILIGNHDSFFKDTIETNSLSIFKHIDNITIIDDYKIEDDVIYVSWLCNEEEYDNIIKITKKNNINCMFSHLELNNFQINQGYTMEHGSSHKELKHIKKVFTGHYHGRQEKDNIIYVGTPFPYTFSDANDFEKGFCVIDTKSGDHKFINYDNISVLSVSYEDILENDFSDIDNVSIRVVIDENIETELLDEIKERLESQSFRSTKIVYKSTRTDDIISEEVDLDNNGGIMTIDETVITYIDSISDEGIDKEFMKIMYKDVVND